MAHFAQLDENNIVLRVIVVNNDCAPDEATGQEFLASIGFDGTWLQTSYNTVEGVHLLGGTPFRYRFAGIGFSYDPINDAFIPPKPYPSYVFDDEKLAWVNPISKPEGTETTGWKWNEDSLSWEAFTKSLD
jgi:hypothetical protein